MPYKPPQANPYAKQSNPVRIKMSVDMSDWHDDTPPDSNAQGDAQGIPPADAAAQADQIGTSDDPGVTSTMLALANQVANAADDLMPTAAPTGADRNAFFAALKLIYQLVSLVRQFIAKERQAVGTGIVGIHRRKASFPGLDVFYTNHHGKETVHYVARPSNAPAGPQPQQQGAGQWIDIDSIAVVFFNKGT